MLALTASVRSFSIELICEHDRWMAQEKIIGNDYRKLLWPQSKCYALFASYLEISQNKLKGRRT